MDIVWGGTATDRNVSVGICFVRKSPFYQICTFAL